MENFPPSFPALLRGKNNTVSEKCLNAPRVEHFCSSDVIQWRNICSTDSFLFPRFSAGFSRPPPPPPASLKEGKSTAHFVLASTNSSGKCFSLRGGQEGRGRTKPTSVWPGFMPAVPSAALLNRLNRYFTSKASGRKTVTLFSSVYIHFPLSREHIVPFVWLGSPRRGNGKNPSITENGAIFHSWTRRISCTLLWEMKFKMISTMLESRRSRQDFEQP